VISPSRDIDIIGFPMDLGANRRGVDMGPSALRIAGLEEKVRALEARQADPEVYRNPEAASRVAREKGTAEQRLEELYPVWERLTEEMP
jgi:arginase family enzyme